MIAFLKKYLVIAFSFKGRVSRKWFWLGNLIAIPLYLVTACLIGAATTLLFMLYTSYIATFTSQIEYEQSDLLCKEVALLLSFIPYGLFSASLFVRRLHDIGLSGYRYLVFPILGMVPLLIPNLSTVNHVINLALFIYLLNIGFTLGNNGDNSYGNDPYAKPNLA